MMSTSFKGEYVPFYIRLLKRLAPLFLIIFICLFRLHYGRSAEKIIWFRPYFYGFIAICIPIGIYYHTNKIRTIVNEVRLSGMHFHIIGQDFYSRYEDTLDISKTILEIQQEEIGKNKTRYCIEIFSDGKYYYLNKFNDWEYKTLAAIVDEFQSKTGKIVNGMEFYDQLA
ncbi:MAG: hypothetical protein QM710_02990 [Flavobacterium sp.]